MADLNKIMIDNSLAVVEETGACALIVFVDSADDWDFWRSAEDKKMLVLVTQKEETEKELALYKDELKAVLRLPAVRLTRLGQIKLSVIFSITEGVIKGGDRVVCLTGPSSRGVLDTMMALDLSKETEVFTTMDISSDLLKRVKPEVLEAVLNIAIELAGEGREGKAVGTTFVIGDHEKVGELSRPLIMNPFRGYPEEMRNILDDSVRETIKEFALLDGAFIVREDGTFMSAGVHLDAALDKEGHMPGLGCRHMAAAGITDVTEAAAITISGSTGMVRIFMKGRVIFEMERPVWSAVKKGPRQQWKEE